jgi:hypothetical protein
MKDGAFKKGQGAGGAPAHILGESHRGEEEDEERGEEIDELHLVGVLVFWRLVWSVEVLLALGMGRFCFKIEVNTSNLIERRIFFLNLKLCVLSVCVQRVPKIVK